MDGLLEQMRQAILLLARINHMNPRWSEGQPKHDVAKPLERCGHPVCRLFQEYLRTEGDNG